LKDLEKFMPVSCLTIKKSLISRESVNIYKKFPITPYFQDDNSKSIIFKQLEILIKIIDLLQIIFKLRKKHKIEEFTLINFDRFFVNNTELIYLYNESIVKVVDKNIILNLKKNKNQNNDNDASNISNRTGFSLHQAIFESPKQAHEEDKSSLFYMYYLKRFVIRILEKNGFIGIIKKDKEKLKHFTNINSLKILKFSLGNILFNLKELKEIKKESKLDFTFVKHNLDCLFPENNLKFLMLYDSYSLSSNFNNDIISIPLCIGCVECYLNSMYPANIRGLRLSSCLEVWKLKSKLDVKFLINYLKYFNFTIDLDYKRLSEKELMLKSVCVEVYKKETDSGLYIFEFSNNIDMSYRYSNTTNADRLSYNTASEN
jgi:hypothetical protein